MPHRFLRVSTIAVLACLPAATAIAQSKFEGVITARLAGTTDVTYSLKGDQFRMDMSGRGMAIYMLHDGSAKSTFMVMPTQKMYMDPTAMAGMTGQAAAAADKKTFDFKMTGRKETIAGYECEHMLVTGDDGQYDICGAKGLGTFATMNNPMAGRGGGPSDSWQRGMSKDFFPLKVQKVGGDVVLEVVKVEKKSLDSSLFTVPSDFTKMDLGSMGRMGRPPVE